MTNINEWARTCLGKKKYYSDAIANRVAAEIKLERGVTLRVYNCPHCFRWHLTSRMEKKK